MDELADQFIDRWHAGIARALDDALAFLSAHPESPFSDGILGEWLRELGAFRFEERHLVPIISLLKKRDPHLQEAGVGLAAAALRTVDGAEAIEPALTALISAPDLDPWVLQSVVDLLSGYIGPRGPLFTQVYRVLVRLKPGPGPRRGLPCIMRNRAIDPFRDLIQLYEQHLLQTLNPTPRDLLLLPILEARHHTRGWQATLVRVLQTMGNDVDQHLRVLKGI